MSNKIKVKPIKTGKKTWSNYEHPIYKGCKNYLTTYIDAKGRMQTGLTPEDEVRLGEILGKDLRYTSSFWYDYRVVISNRGLELDLDNPEDELKYKVLMNHPEVSKSIEDKNPRARFIIHNEEEISENRSNKALLKAKAYEMFAKLTDSQKRDVLKLYPNMYKASKESPSLVTDKLSVKLEEDPETFIQMITDKDKETKVLIKDLITNRVLTQNGSIIKYEGDVIGHNLEAAVDFLKDPLNQSLKVALMAALKEKTK